MGNGDIPSGVSKLAVPEAARALGISPEAVRNRLSRGTLKSVKEGGTVYVLLEGDIPQHTTDIPTDRPPDASRELLEELRDRVRYLERVLEEEREARTDERRRHDTLMAQLMQRIPEIEAPPEPREPHASAVTDEEAEAVVSGRQTPLTAEAPQSTWERLREGPERAETRPSGEEAQEGTERRSLWQRLFGG